MLKMVDISSECAEFTPPLGLFALINDMSNGESGTLNRKRRATSVAWWVALVAELADDLPMLRSL